jgi:predicted transcriptional regulator
MIALPMWSPWDWLLVLGAKRVETRSRAPWPRMVGHRIAVYSTVSFAPGGKRGLLEQAAEPHFHDWLAGVEEYPRGAVIGTVVLERFSVMTPESIATLEREHPAEFAFGLYLPGRFAWVMSDPVLFEEPVEARPPKGQRGPFEWTPPAVLPASSMTVADAVAPATFAAGSGQLSLLGDS